MLLFYLTLDVISYLNIFSLNLNLSLICLLFLYFCGLSLFKRQLLHNALCVANEILSIDVFESKLRLVSFIELTHRVLKRKNRRV